MLLVQIYALLSRLIGCTCRRNSGILNFPNKGIVSYHRVFFFRQFMGKNYFPVVLIEYYSE